MARLLIFDEAVRGVELPLHPVVVGRSRKIDIPIRDSMLSRKHCGIVPLESGYRLLDLRSANGTYVNGIRVDKFDLSYDDVIEIGNTVIVFVDTDNLPSGKRLAQLRNPQKAQELIERVSRRSRKAGVHSAVGAGQPCQGTREALREAIERALLGELDGTQPQVVLRNLLEGRVLQEVIDRLVATSQPLRRVVREAAERVLEDPTLPSDLDALPQRIREALNQCPTSKENTKSETSAEEGAPPSPEVTAGMASRPVPSAESETEQKGSEERRGISPPLCDLTSEGGVD